MKENLSLIVNKVSCTRNSINIFKPLTFKVYKGQLLVIKGKNGTGKTTLLHCLAGIIPYQGVIKWKVKNKKIGYVGHKFGLKEYETVEEFINFWREVYKSQIILEDIVRKFSLSKLIYSPIGFLSYGQKKKLSFIRLFLLKSKIWLLDEPFSGMDAINRNMISKMIEKNINNNGIVLMSTHESRRILNVKNKKEIEIV